ncbi:predicted protein [Naegleria gruberi]|uniref:Predicted protein n=1 Tax=Naegleria gruberi TaxID=5762 RepID=D2V451_NAEGR|nr:uncharacterized protein NAEGRDRAFT_60329 [Naegleria gruberi]EFC48459.1 predicted protein [Naegleria gruberi]|eukprot:XP_002681203.1 predicted protein [Naegleria gruberi strain NEG-M]
MQPYWEYCAKLIPNNVAPNTVTLLGFLGVILGWIILIYYNINLENQVPSIVYLLNGIFLFYYQTMDAIDGKHARNTKNSSALGELFDHGLDALIGYFQCIILVSSCDLGNSYYSIIVIILYYMTSMMMIWEDYVTDEMRFGKFNSPTEAIMFAIFILFYTFIMGQSSWSTVVFTIYRNDNNIIYYYLFKLFTNNNNTDNITNTIINNNNILNIQFNYLIITIATLLGASIIINNIKTVLKFASHSTRKRSHRTILIFARVCGALAPSWFIIMLPTLLLSITCFIFNDNSNIMIILMHSCLLFIITCYIHMAYHVIHQVCSTLNIHAFKVKPKNN